MAEKKRAKLSEQTTDRLYEMIVEERRYAPGSKLPNENELSRALEVSRTTLREAISFAREDTEGFVRQTMFNHMEAQMKEQAIYLRCTAYAEILADLEGA